MRALFIGAHCDDIELGCGGTINKRRDEWEIHCLVLSHKIKYDHWDSGKSYSGLDEICRASLTGLGARSVEIHDLPCTRFYERRQELWEIVHAAELAIRPDVVFSHYIDTHQDHETVYRETLRNFKSTSVYMYRPHPRDNHPYPTNAYSRLSREDWNAKLAALQRYQMYSDKVYFKAELLEAQLLYFGSHIVGELAEGFVVEKNLL